MSKNITISEGENARVFGNTKKLKTLLQGEDAGSCFWVPEDETQVNPTYIMENGLHTAADAGEYGFSVAHVNVPGKVTDIDGIDWDITIDEDGIPHIEIDDSDIEITIDDETSEIEVTIDEEPVVIDPEELDLDPDEDIDISFDPEDMDVDIVGTDLDGDDVVIDLDPITGDFDTLDCPASIQIMHVPNKTEYTDGWAIDYDGLVVQAFDKDGNPWTSPDYPDGYIPAHKLDLQKYAEYNEAEARDVIPDYDDSGLYTVTTFEDCMPSGGRAIVDDGAYAAERAKYSGPAIIYSTDVQGDYQGGSPLTAYVFTSIKTGDTVELGKFYPCVAIYTYGGNGSGGIAKAGQPIHIERASSSNTSHVLYIGGSGREVSGIGAHKSSIATSSIPVNWRGPCLEELTASFDISVSESTDHGGSHHSGKF